MDHYLDNNKLKEYKAKLKAKAEELQARIKENSLLLSEKMSATGDVIDIAAEHEEYLSAKRDMERAQVMLKDIGKILNDFEDYGYCLDCGIEIGENAIIGAGSVVTKNIKAFTTVYGNPARVKK